MRFEHDSSTIRLRGVRDAYDSSTIQHPTKSYEEPTRSYAHSSNNEHVNSFALLYGVVANQRVAGGERRFVSIYTVFIMNDPIKNLSGQEIEKLIELYRSSSVVCGTAQSLRC